VETQDGGDAKVETSPRDIVYTQPAEASEDEQPTILHKLDLRYGYKYKLICNFLSWLVVSVSWFDTLCPPKKKSLCLLLPPHI